MTSHHTPRSMTRTLLLGAALLAAPSALAQQHGQMDHSQMDHSQMPDTAAPAMGHEALMALHERMMADPEIHARMMADPEMQALMQGTMPAEHVGMAGMDHSQMAGMDHSQMGHGAMGTDTADQMRTRMAAMSPTEHTAFMARMEAAHQRLMADPDVRRRIMADPEMHRMMMAMPGGMDMGAMPGMTGEADRAAHHGQVDHSQMSGTDHAAGVAMQRRNAGITTGDERPLTSAVSPDAFNASATADRFHAALASGDRAAMETLLAPEAVVLEDGRAEARTEYLSGHFVRDAAALAGTAPESLFRRTGTAGDAAWVASTQRIGAAGMAELLVMKRTPEGWRVAAVHWSSVR